MRVLERVADRMLTVVLPAAEAGACTHYCSSQGCQPSSTKVFRKSCYFCSGVGHICGSCTCGGLCGCCC